MLAQPVEVHLERGERRSELIMDFACYTRLFLFANRLQVTRQRAQLFAGALDLELRQPSLRVVEHQSVPENLAAVQTTGARANVDPFLVGPMRRKESPRPVPGGELRRGGFQSGSKMRTLGSRDQAEERFGIGLELRLGQADQGFAALAYVRKGNAAGAVAEELEYHPGNVGGHPLVAGLAFAQRAFHCAAGRVVVAGA